MNDETKAEPEPEVVEAEVLDEKPKINWEHKTEFGINSRMRDVIDLALKVAEAEIETYKKKINKLTYGS